MLFTTRLRLVAAAAALLLTQPVLANSEGGPKAGPAKPGRAAQKPMAAPRQTVVASASPTPAAPTATDTTAPAAPQTVTLTGVVLRPDGTPCAGAAVFVAGAPRQLVVTDAKGAFALPVPAAAPFSLQADLFGEGSSRLAVTTPVGQPVRLVLGR